MTDTTVVPTTTTVLDEATVITSGARQEKYGHPRENFDKIAAIWGAILGTPVTAEQVGLCMIGVKLARFAHKADRDSLVDIAGYARTLEMLTEES